VQRLVVSSPTAAAAAAAAAAAVAAVYTSRTLLSFVGRGGSVASPRRRVWLQIFDCLRISSTFQVQIDPQTLNPEPHSRRSEASQRGSRPKKRYVCACQGWNQPGVTALGGTLCELGFRAQVLSFSRVVPLLLLLCIRRIRLPFPFQEVEATKHTRRVSSQAGVVANSRRPAYL
jgi:hypothetical protein